MNYKKRHKCDITVARQNNIVCCMFVDIWVTPTYPRPYSPTNNTDTQGKVYINATH